MSIYVALVFAIIGLVIYGFSTNPKASEVGRLMFAIGFLVWLWQVIGTKITNLFH